MNSTACPLEEALNDLLGADKTDRQHNHMEFVRERLLERRVNFNDPIKKLKLKTFAKIAKTVKVASKSKRTKQIAAGRSVFSQLVMIAIKHISLEECSSFPLVLSHCPWQV